MVEKNQIESFVLNENICEKKDVVKYGNAYFISGGGNHRLCFAKFLGLKEVKCDVREYFFDNEAYTLFQKLESLGLNPDIHDRNSWQLKLGKLNISIDIEQIPDFLFYFREIRITKWDRFLWKHFNKSAPTYDFVHYNNHDITIVKDKIKKYYIHRELS